MPHEVNSLWRAEQLGGSEHVGWGVDQYLAAEQVDAVKALISIEAHKGKRGPVKFSDPVYRPGTKNTVPDAPEVPPTLDNFDITALVAQIGAS